MMAPNIIGASDLDVGLIDYFTGSMHNESNDETYIITNGRRLLYNNPSKYIVGIIDTNKDNSCFYHVIYLGSPEWYFKSERSKLHCFNIHKNELHKALFPSYIPYDCDFKVISYLYKPNEFTTSYKLVVHATDHTNVSMNSYITGTESSYNLKVLSNNEFYRLSDYNSQSIFKIKWIGPLNVQYIRLTISTPLYTSENFTSHTISVISQPNTINSLLNPELDTIYVWDRFSLPATALCYSYPVNNAQLQIFVEDYNSQQSYGISTPLLAIYMILLGEDSVFEYISSSLCSLSSATTSEYTDSNGNAMFRPYFEEGTPGKYTIYIRHNSLFTEAKSFVLKNKISKVAIQNNINQTINAPFFKLNKVIYPYTVTLAVSPMLSIIGEDGNYVNGKENRIKAYIFTIDEINAAMANRNTSKNKLRVVDFETSLYKLNTTIQQILYLLKAISNQISTQKLFYKQTEIYNVRLSNITFDGKYYTLNNVSIILENEGEYAIFFSVDGIESELSGSIIIKDKNQKATIMKWLRNGSLLLIIGLLILSNIVCAKYVIIMSIALISVFGYSIKDEAIEYYSFYYAIIVLLTTFLLYFVIQLFKKRNLVEPNTMDLPYKVYTISKFCNTNSTNTFLSHEHSKQNALCRRIKYFVQYICKLMTPISGNTFKRDDVIYPTRILIGVVLGLFATAFIFIKLINFYLLLSQKYIN